MGMYDDIIVPKAYLKSLLTKDQEKRLKTVSRYGGSVRGIEFQTKSLENILAKYKVYKQTLFTNDKSLWNCEPPNTEQRNENTSKKYPYEKGRWTKVSFNGIVNFYTSFHDKDENMWWVELEFTFVNGVLDKKELIKFEIEETAEEAEEREEEFKVKEVKTKIFQRTFRYKFFSKLSILLRKLLSWSEQKTYINYISMPAEKREKEKLSFWKHY